AGVVEATGVVLDKSKHNQLLTALKSLLLSRAHPFADIKADGSAAVAEALSNLGLGTAATKNVGTGSNQLPDMSSFAASLSVSGWQKLPGGLIIQWGQVLSNSGGFAPWTYPIAFSTACFHVYATPFVGASANNFTLTEIGNPGLTAVTTCCYVNGVQSSTAGQVGVRYLAIGY
ncbi:gp53-like domain-containing protein, partial [Enterobacter roggenkampii]|uniref:gp53-like domain-containing protein n=1 Tax=Enterobacter roggenkampii TaxID=1812935 RepID=UPI003BD78986